VAGSASEPGAGWAAVQLLADPTRRRIFDAVRAAHAPVSRDEVASAAGVHRPLAAFHLDRLADAGLLKVTFARPPGRTGRGAGRPTKRYDAREVTVAASVPARNHDLVGRILARAVAEAPKHADEQAQALAEAEGQRIGETRRPGRRLSGAATMDAASDALSRLGYEPELVDGVLRLRNCPFHGIVEAAPELVCAMNHRLVTGLLCGLGGARAVGAELDPTPGECCVTVAKRRPALHRRR
jgi:predicted ArsR family transcriptional regulator